MPIKVGAQVQPQHSDFAGMRRAWVEAEELGCDSVFTWDHFYPLFGDPDGQHYECMTSMASLAEATERVQIGALVCCNSYRNPELLADCHRTVDHISGGRVILGIGSGWFERDYDEYGYEFGSKGSRGRDLEAALPRIKSRLGKLHPPPLGDMPILIAGRGPKITLRLVAEHADAWHGFGDLDEFKRCDAILRSHCDRIGRDHTEIERTWGAPRDGAAADALVAAGVTHFTVGVSGNGTSGYDLARLREMLQWRDAR